MSRDWLAALVALPVLLLALARPAPGDDRPASAARPEAGTPNRREVLRGEADLLREDGRIAEAARALQELGELEQKRSGAGSDDHLRCLDELAAVQELGGELAGALATRRRIEAAVAGRFGPDSRPAADARLTRELAERLAALAPDGQGRYAEACRDGRAARGLIRQRRYAEAVARAGPAAEALRRLLGEDNVAVLAALNDLAHAHDRAGQLEQAAAVNARLLRLTRQVRGPRHPDAAAVLNNLSILAARTGDFSRARDLGREALALRREALGPDHSATRQSVVNLLRVFSNAARGHETRDELAQARRWREEGLTLAADACGPDHWRTVRQRQELKYHDRLAALAPAERRQLETAERRTEELGGHLGRGEGREALAAAREAAAITGRLLGDESSRHLANLHNLAAAHEVLGQLDAAEELYQRVLRDFTRLLGPNDPACADALNQLGLVEAARGRLDRAGDHGRRALAIREQAYGPASPEALQSARNLAQTLRKSAQACQKRGDAAGEIAAMEQAAALNARVHGPDHWLVTQDRLWLELARLQAGWTETQRRRLGELTGGHGQIKDLVQRQRYPEARDRARSLLAATGALLGEGHHNYAAALNDLALTLDALGQVREAEALYRRAMVIDRAVLGENHPGRALTLASLAGLREAQGDAVEAEALYRQARRLARLAADEQPADYALVLMGCGAFYQHLGDLASAQPLLEHALQLYVQARGADNFQTLGAANNLALFCQAQGRYDDAERLLRRVHDACRQQTRDYRELRGTVLNNLAALDERRGDYEAARQKYLEAIELTRDLFGPASVRHATELGNLGVLLQKMRRHDEAEKAFLDARRILDDAAGPRHPEYARVLSNLASLCHVLGRHDQALALAEEALSRDEAALNSTFAALSERQRRELAYRLRDGLNGVLTVGLDARAPAARLYAHVLAWKGAVAARQDEERLARDHPALQPLVQDVARARARLAKLAYGPPATGSVPDWLDQVDAARREKEERESQLARRLAALRPDAPNGAVSPARAGPDQVAAALPAGAALVDLVEYVHFHPPGEKGGPLRQERRLAAFVLRRGRPAVALNLAPAADVARGVQAWRQALADQDAPALGRAAAEVRRLVWQPLEPSLEGATTVVVAPDTALCRMPLAALPGRRPGSYLIEDVAIGYVTSGRHALAALTQPVPAQPTAPAQPAAPVRPPAPARAGGGLLSVGGIDYNARPDAAPAAPAADPDRIALAGRPAPRDRSGRAGFEPLPGTAAEVRTVEQAFRAAFPESPHLRLEGAAASEARLKDELARPWRCFHFAGHGFFASPRYVAALQAGASEPEARQRSALTPADRRLLDLDPALLSGLVTAGANRPPASDTAPAGEDGILTAEEVAGLDLRRTDLVVLSACETGLGRTEAREGVLGLQRAFQAAGARTLVTSLWKVDDVATQALMTEFYRNMWTRRLGKLESLRQAQLKMILDYDPRAGQLRGPGTLVPADPEKLARARANAANGREPLPPLFWAAFVLSGQW